MHVRMNNPTKMLIFLEICQWVEKLEGKTLLESDLPRNRALRVTSDL